VSEGAQVPHAIPAVATQLLGRFLSFHDLQTGVEELFDSLSYDRVRGEYRESHDRSDVSQIGVPRRRYQRLFDASLAAPL
jgi:hypothetical protein